MIDDVARIADAIAFSNSLDDGGFEPDLVQLMAWAFEIAVDGQDVRLVVHDRIWIVENAIRDLRLAVEGLGVSFLHAGDATVLELWMEGRARGKIAIVPFRLIQQGVQFEDGWIELRGEHAAARAETLARLFRDASQAEQQKFVDDPGRSSAG